MKSYKNLWFVCAFIGASFSVSGQELAFNTDLGQDRMFEIMKTGPEGLVSFYKNIKLVETLNLALDLNLAEISERFNCMLVIGRKFLLNAFDNLVSPKDQSSLIADRQHSIFVLAKNTQLREQLHALLKKAAEHEAVVIKFMQQKQDVLDNLPKGYVSKACVKSPAVQAMHQAKWGTIAGVTGFGLAKIAPFYEYFYKAPEDLIKGKKPEDFYPKYDNSKTGVSGFLYNMDTAFKAVPDAIMLGQSERASYQKHTENRFADIHGTKEAAYLRQEGGQLQAEFIRLEGIQANLASLDSIALKQYESDKSELEKKMMHLRWADYNLKEYQERYAKNPSQYEKDKLEFEKNKLWEDRFVMALYAGAYTAVASTVAVCSYSVYKMYTTHLEGLKVRDSLYAMNQLIATAEQIELLCKTHGIKNQFAMSAVRDKNTLDLISKLKAYRYGNNTSVFVASAATRTFMYEVYEKDMHLAPIFAAVAEMDALHAIADKMVATQISGNKICFSKFIDHATPMIKTDAFWSVLVNHAVANSFHDHHNVILTGPNAGGKSTAIRALLQNIVFAQSFGVAAATQFELTQFDVLHSFINVSDDILGGLSLFATEVKRAQDIMQRIKALSADEKYFFALDELFTGTNAEDGEMCAYKFIGNISNYPNTQFIYATHFNKLKEVGATNKDCVNYRIDAPKQNSAGEFIRDAKGRLMYPYTLSKGANNISVAKEIAYDAGLF